LIPSNLFAQLGYQHMRDEDTAAARSAFVDKLLVHYNDDNDSTIDEGEMRLLLGDYFRHAIEQARRYTRNDGAQYVAMQRALRVYTQALGKLHRIAEDVLILIDQNDDDAVSLLEFRHSTLWKLIFDTVETYTDDDGDVEDDI
jgi:hypothetical protein